MGMAAAGSMESMSMEKMVDSHVAIYESLFRGDTDR